MLRNKHFLHKNNHSNIPNKKNYHKYYNFDYKFNRIVQYNFNCLINNVHYSKYKFDLHYKKYNLLLIFKP